MTKTPEAISRSALMKSLRELGFDVNSTRAMHIDYDGVEVENFVFNGKNKVVEMGKDGELYPKTETIHVRFVD